VGVAGERGQRGQVETALRREAKPQYRDKRVDVEEREEEEGKGEEE